MAFRDAAHRLEVFKSPEFKRMLDEYKQEGFKVPLAVFQETYGRAFFDSRGRASQPSRTQTSRLAFLTLMRATGRAPNDVTTWDEWLEYNGYE